MSGKQKTAPKSPTAQKQARLEDALRANLGKRKIQARARDGKSQAAEKQPDESLTKR